MKSKTMFRLAVGAWCLMSAIVAPAAVAQAYPDRPIEVIVPGPAGGTPDVVARLVGEQLHKILGEPIIVSNRAGASGFIGVQAVARAKPDGYSLLMGFAQTMAVNPVTFKKVPYDPIADFEAIGRMVDFELVLAVPASLPVKNVPELLTWLKEHQGQAAFGSFGAGSPSQFAGEMFGKATDTAALHVPYKGSAPLVTDLVGGQVHYGFVVLQVAQQLAHSGKLRILAVTGDQRQLSEPDVPTLKELGYDQVQATGWYGLYAPKHTPLEIVDKLQNALEQAMQTPELQEKLSTQGVRPAFLPGKEFEQYTKDEIQRWQAIVTETGFTAQE